MQTISRTGQGRILKWFCLALFFVGGCKKKKSPPTDNPNDSGEKNPRACSNVDQSDLKAVAQCYWPKGEAPESAPRYWLLSEEAKSQISKKDYSDDGNYQTVKVKVLGTPTKKGTTYGLVRHDWRVPEDDCVHTAVKSFIKEDGRWRRHYLRKSEKKAAELTNDGAIKELKKHVENWLDKDPFSLTARKMQIRAAVVSKNSSSNQGNLVREMIDLAPTAKSTLDARYRVANGAEAMKLVIKKTPKIWCYYDEIVNKTARALAYQSPRESVQILKKFGDVENPGHRITKVVALTKLKRPHKAAKLLDEAARQEVLKYLEDVLPSPRAEYLCTAGAALSDAGENEVAEKWIKKGLNADPASELCGALLDVVR